MGVSYDIGGNCVQMLNALNIYGISGYSIAYNIIPLTIIKNDISSKKPIIMVSATYVNGETKAHATTITGYSTSAGITRIFFWNSGNKQLQSCTYTSSAVTYAYAGYTLSWLNSIY